MIAAVYARKSTEQHGVADEAKSVTRQIEHACAYATSKGWSVAEEHVYADDGISGALFGDRNWHYECARDLVAGKITGVSGTPA